MKNRNILFGILGIVVAMAFGIFFSGKTEENHSITQNPLGSRSVHGSEISVTPLIANDDVDDSQAITEIEYLKEVYGLLPYLSNELLDSLGAKTPSQKVAVNNLVEETFYKILDTVIQTGEVTKLDRSTLVTAPAFEEATRNQLIIDHHFRLESILGSEKYSSLTELNLIEHIHHKLMYFGEGPLSISMNRESPNQVNVSIVTSLRNFGSNELHSVNKSVGQEAFEENFPMLASLLE